ncbi:hypothetical protein AAFF_G00190660 [Aldrovandia affinis]|uniref:Uncharacterized protein n=1 Tax=Aldrovandia affinis TaxID=143900 RepID=A0AAD7VX20_9TELE|nr:hypothetical protein AAFF_G00190660 [Aldrovandia affinis]
MTDRSKMASNAGLVLLLLAVTSEASVGVRSAEGISRVKKTHNGRERQRESTSSRVRYRERGSISRALLLHNGTLVDLRKCGPDCAAVPTGVGYLPRVAEWFGPKAPKRVALFDSCGGIATMPNRFSKM